MTVLEEIVKNLCSNATLLIILNRYNFLIHFTHSFQIRCIGYNYKHSINTKLKMPKRTNNNINRYSNF